MAAGNGRWFLQAGFLISWLGLASAAAGAEPLPAPAASDCGELPPVLPEAPEGLWMETQGTRYLNCGAAASDGTGAVILSTTPYSYTSVDIQGWGPGGSWSTYFLTDTFEPYGQPGGFLSFSSRAQYYLSYLDSQTWQFTHSPPEPGNLVKVAADPRGGLRALFDDGTLKAYGPTGATLWSTPLALSAPVAALGVDAQGHTLVLTGSAQGLWVDASGQPSAPFLARAPGPLNAWGSSFVLVPQAEQGLFLGVPSGDTMTWTAYAPMDPQAHPAPAWLSNDAARPLVRLPSGKGYLRWGRPLACQHEAEVLSASGQSCGKTRFPALPPDRWGQCGSMSLGPDGTAIETFARDSRLEGDEGGYNEVYFCRARWWPALFNP